MSSDLSSWDTYKVFTLFRKFLEPDIPCTSPFHTLKRPNIQPQNCWPNMRWAVKLSGLERFKRPDTRLKANNKPKRFSRSNYTEKNIETERRFYLCWITYVMEVNIRSKEYCFLGSFSFWLALDNSCQELGIPRQNGRHTSAVQQLLS